MRGFERRAFKSLFPDGNYREAERRLDGLDTPVIVYHPLVNRFSGQKLRVIAKQLTGYYKFTTEEKLILRRELSKYAEANCIVLFVGYCRVSSYVFYEP